MHTYLHDGVVECDAPRRRLLDDPALQLLVPGEGVDRQRLRLRFQERDAVFDLLDLAKTDAGACSAASGIHSDSASNASANVHAHRDDREQRAEDLLRHDVGVERRVQQQRGLDAPAQLGEHRVRHRRRFSVVALHCHGDFLQRLGVAVPAVHHGGRHPAVRQEVAQPVEVLLVQDASHVLRLGEEPLQGRLEQLDLQEE